MFFSGKKLSPFFTFSLYLIYLNSKVYILTPYFSLSLLNNLYILFHVLTLHLWLQHCHNDFLLCNVILSRARHTRDHHRLCWCFSLFVKLSKDLASYSRKLGRSAWAHTTGGFQCFPNHLGINVNNPVSTSLIQPSIASGCIAGKSDKCWTILRALLAARNWVPQDILPSDFFGWLLAIKGTNMEKKQATISLRFSKPTNILEFNEQK